MNVLLSRMDLTKRYPQREGGKELATGDGRGGATNTGNSLIVYRCVVACCLLASSVPLRCISSLTLCFASPTFFRFRLLLLIVRRSQEAQRGWYDCEVELKVQGDLGNSSWCTFQGHPATGEYNRSWSSSLAHVA